MLLIRASESVRLNEGTRISGLALTPQISRNDTLYTVNQLARADGMVVPLNVEHGANSEFGNRQIGTATFHYDAELEQLNYEADITDPGALAWARGKDMHVSIEAQGTSESEVCNEGECFRMPAGLQFIGLALTESPGITVSTVNFESVGKTVISGKTAAHTYIQAGRTTHMSEAAATTTAAKEEAPNKTTIVTECPEGYRYDANAMVCVPTSAEAKARLKEFLAKEDTADVNMDKGAADDTASECGPGMQKDLDGNCVPADNKEGAPAPAPKSTEMDNGKKKDCECDKDKESAPEPSGHGMPNMDELNKNIEAQVAKGIEAGLKKASESIPEAVHRSLYGGTEVPQVGYGSQGMDRVIAEAKGAVDTIGRYKFGVDVEKAALERIMESAIGVAGRVVSLKEDFYKPYSEAVTFSGGNDAGQRMHVSNRIKVDPAGLQTTHIRDLVQFAEIPVGTTEAVFEVSDAYEGAVVTEGTVTAPQANANAVQTIKLDSFPTVGATEIITRATFENSYAGVLDMMAKKASIASTHLEAKTVFRDVANAIPAGSLGGWLSAAGNDITDDDVADNLGTLNSDVISEAEAILRTRGYSGMGSEEFCLAITPNQLHQLRSDDDIDRWLSYSQDGERRTTGDIPRIHNVTIIPMQAIGTVNAGQNVKARAVMFVKDYTFLLGSKRNVEISMIDQPSRYAVDWAWGKRIASDVFKPQSAVRISTEA